VVDSSEEDESDEEMTEADKQFIVDDEEEVEDGADDDEEAEAEAERKRKKRRKREREKEEDLDEDDLDLIDENLGRAPRKDKFKRLRKKGEERSEDYESSKRRSNKDLSGIFEDDGGSDGAIDEDMGGRRNRADNFDERELMSSEDELDGFIEHDDEEGLNEEQSAEIRAQIRQMRKSNLAQNYGVSDEYVSVHWTVQSFLTYWHIVFGMIFRICLVTEATMPTL
jgi:transcription elongation factor SPT6